MLEIKNVKKSFILGKNEIEVLKGIDLSFPDKGLYVILGPSGSGKSTLLSIMGALEEPTSGSVKFCDEEITALSEKEKDVLHQKYFSFIFQEHNLIEYLSLLDNSLLKSEKKDRDNEIFKRLGVEELLKKKPNELSGGEKERCAIARALLADTKVVFCDEPTASLDSANAENVISLLKEVSKEKLVIVISHDEKLCAKYTDNLIYIRDGKITKNAAKPQQNDEKIEINLTKSSKNYHRGFFKYSFAHSLFKYKHTILITVLSFIAYLCVSIIIALASGSRNVVNNALEKVMHSNPVTISSYYQEFSSFRLLSDTKAMVDGNVHAQSKASLTDTLHMNVITDDFVNYVTKNKLDNVYFSFNNDCSYPVIYKEDGIYKLYDNEKRDDLNDFLEVFLGKRSVFSELIFEEKYFDENMELIGGHYPQNENEAVILLDGENLVNEDVLTILDVKEGSKPIEFLGKEFALANNDDIFVANESKEIEGYFPKTKEEISASGKDIRSLTNFLIDYANAYYDGDKESQEFAANEVRGFFNETKETRTLNSYSKIQNSGLLEGFYKNNSENIVKIVGVYKMPLNEAFTEKGTGILIPREKLKMHRAKQSLSKISKELDAHVVLDKRTGDLDMPNIYSYRDSVKKYSNSSLEDFIMNYFEYFENRKFYCVNNEYTNLEIYCKKVSDKEFFTSLINDYNKGKNKAYQIKPLDMAKMIIVYFNRYYGVIEKVLYVISIITLVVSSVLSLAIIFNLVALRVKEIAVFRSSGFSAAYLFGLIEIENVILGFISGGFALGVAHLLMPSINNFFRNSADGLMIEGIASLNAWWSLIILGLTLITSFLAALIPSLIYSKKRVNEILRN